MDTPPGPDALPVAAAAEPPAVLSLGAEEEAAPAALERFPPSARDQLQALDRGAITKFPRSYSLLPDGQVSVVVGEGSAQFDLYELTAQCESDPEGIVTHPLFVTDTQRCVGLKAKSGTGPRTGCSLPPVLGEATCKKHSAQGLRAVASGSLPYDGHCALCGRQFGPDEPHATCVSCVRQGHYSCILETGDPGSELAAAAASGSYTEVQCADCHKNRGLWFVASPSFRAGISHFPVATIGVPAPRGQTPAPARLGAAAVGERARLLAHQRRAAASEARKLAFEELNLKAKHEADEPSGAETAPQAPAKGEDPPAPVDSVTLSRDELESLVQRAARQAAAAAVAKTEVQRDTAQTAARSLGAASAPFVPPAGATSLAPAPAALAQSHKWDYAGCSPDKEDLEVRKLILEQHTVEEIWLIGIPVQPNLNNKTHVAALESGSLTLVNEKTFVAPKRSQFGTWLRDQEAYLREQGPEQAERLKVLGYLQYHFTALDNAHVPWLRAYAILVEASRLMPARLKPDLVPQHRVILAGLYQHSELEYVALQRGGMLAETLELKNDKVEPATKKRKDKCMYCYSTKHIADDCTKPPPPCPDCKHLHYRRGPRGTDCTEPGCGCKHVPYVP